VNPGGQVIGSQHVPAPGSPAGMQTSPLGQVTQVIVPPIPQPGLIGKHDGALTVAHVSGLQQVPLSHVSVPQFVEQSSTVPVQGSVLVPQ
jgi:hypothetical protein